MQIIRRVGNYTLNICSQIGSVTLFIVNNFLNLFSYPFFFKEFAQQLINIGFYSLPLVGLTTIFVGMVLALQTYTGFARFSGESAVASVVVISITRELGPVMTGLMVAARVSSSMAAELGAMRVSEQIDALKTMNVNPYKFLTIPRILACIIALPILTLVGDCIGVFGGFLVGVTALNFSSYAYMDQTILNLEAIDVISGLVKSAFFGFSMSLFGCYCGFNSEKGAQGVGTSTINAVVLACSTILIFNYILTSIFFSS